LDLLLLTQGWRRYIWNEENLKSSASDNKPVIFDWTEGEVKATRKQKKAKEMLQIVMAFNTGENDIKDFIVADSQGRFKIMPIHLKTWQGEYVYLKPMAAEDVGSRINLDKPFETINNILDLKQTMYPLPIQLHAENEEPVRPYVIAPNVIELGEVTVRVKGIKLFRDKYMGHLDSLVKLDLNDDWVCPHGFLHNYRQGYFHCVGSSPPYHQCCADSLKAKPVEGKMYRLVQYEDVGRSDGRWVLTDLSDVEYHYPKFTEEELLKMNNLYRVKAYYNVREFYQPNYDKADSTSMIPDYRNTLLWAPTVLTDRNGEAQLEFFCSDIYTGFVGIIEGVSGDGKLGSDSFEFKVLKTKPFGWEK